MSKYTRKSYDSTGVTSKVDFPHFQIKIYGKFYLEQILRSNIKIMLEGWFGYSQHKISI